METRYTYMSVVRWLDDGSDGGGGGVYEHMKLCEKNMKSMHPTGKLK